MFQSDPPCSFKLPGLGIADTDSLAWRETSSVGVSWILMAADEYSGSGSASDSGSDSGGRPPGAERRRQGAAVLIRMAPGRGYPAHRHLGAEDVLVLQGGYEDEWGRHVQGDFVRYPPGSNHTPVALGDPDAAVDATNPACILFSSIAEGIELLQA